MIVDPLEEGPGLADRVLEGESVRPEDVLCRPDPKDQVLPGGRRDGNPALSASKIPATRSPAALMAEPGGGRGANLRSARAGERGRPVRERFGSVYLVP